METVKTVQCPYCFESIKLWIDPSDEGSMVRDCDVCCNPWQLHVERIGTDEVRVRVERAQ